LANSGSVPEPPKKERAFQEKIAPTCWKYALPLRFIDDGVPTRAAVSGYLEDGRELVGVVPHPMLK
jgi:hypothetical protein